MQEGSILASLAPLVALFAIFWFLVIRPQQKQQKQHKNMLAEITKGDKIITNGGLIAEVIKVEENFLKIKLADNMHVKLGRDYISKKVETEDKEA